MEVRFSDVSRFTVLEFFFRPRDFGSHAEAPFCSYIYDMLDYYLNLFNI